MLQHLKVLIAYLSFQTGEGLSNSCLFHFKMRQDVTVDFPLILQVCFARILLDRYCCVSRVLLHKTELSNLRVKNLDRLLRY